MVHDLGRCREPARRHRRPGSAAGRMSAPSRCSPCGTLVDPGRPSRPPSGRRRQPAAGALVVVVGSWALARSTVDGWSGASHRAGGVLAVATPTQGALPDGQPSAVTPPASSWSAAPGRRTACGGRRRPGPGDAHGRAGRGRWSHCSSRSSPLVAADASEDMKAAWRPSMPWRVVRSPSTASPWRAWPGRPAGLGVRDARCPSAGSTGGPRRRAAGSACWWTPCPARARSDADAIGTGRRAAARFARALVGGQRLARYRSGALLRLLAAFVLVAVGTAVLRRVMRAAAAESRAAGRARAVRLAAATTPDRDRARAAVHLCWRGAGSDPQCRRERRHR